MITHSNNYDRITSLAINVGENGSFGHCLYCKCYEQSDMQRFHCNVTFFLLSRYDNKYGESFIIFKIIFEIIKNNANKSTMSLKVYFGNDPLISFVKKLKKKTVFYVVYCPSR